MGIEKYLTEHPEKCVRIYEPREWWKYDRDLGCYRKNRYLHIGTLYKKSDCMVLRHGKKLYRLPLIHQEFGFGDPISFYTYNVDRLPKLELGRAFSKGSLTISRGKYWSIIMVKWRIEDR